MRLIIIAAILTWTSLAHAETVRFYDRGGHSTGTATTYSGGQTKIYDERGRLVGTAVRRPKK
jgi:hypothetical protein